MLLLMFLFFGLSFLDLDLFAENDNLFGVEPALSDSFRVVAKFNIGIRIVVVPNKSLLGNWDTLS